MNRNRTIILICAVAVSALIVWHDVPIEFPGIIIKLLLLFMKLSIVAALTIFALIFSGGKRKSS